MERLNRTPSPETKPRVDSLVEALPFNEAIPRRSGDVAFDHAWEIRAFSMTVALHEELGFPWAEFQDRLVAAIQEFESGRPDLEHWSYYERWMAALEVLARSKGWVSQTELEQRTEEILALPANYMHQHAVREPVAVITGAR
ncbi:MULTISPECIES: nitrile hydratase accessory protein [unclassified Pseudonocardia]|uniref:nitrile hydratase accessory protein n=1 Tax=unclassified Pseudonocardia TaxID=2619320 RepID=UPI0006CB3486|nr:MULTISPECIES: nitrile hydratase accessory protein [unclassified Pseudonocardia]ALE76237.1 nitrile hydratase [Pseudonocardia sp. EC080625-04]ALL78893.1 nitrile hydratase [Pseudonocardia sp. EC080610-09]ALL85101.1 nitrile hydratase [Pseudonocardia sp. EC080619-01]